MIESQLRLFGSSLQIKPEVIAPPFSVLDAQRGRWMARKNMWANLGLDDLRGREEKMIWKNPEILTAYGRKTELPGTSRFDPVLAELLISWFCPLAGRILDPFAGGPTRGIVAAMLGREYLGIDLSAEQIDENYSQALGLCPPALTPEWIVGDSSNLEIILAGRPPADFIFSCPPYFDLEHYTDDPRDLSTMPWPEFLAVYRRIIGHAWGALRKDRFAAWVISDVRDRADQGGYRNLPGQTIDAFATAGGILYNRAIFVTPVVTLAIRAAFSFPISRKLGMQHQEVLVFLKGSWREALKAFPRPSDGELTCAERTERSD